MSWKRQLNRDYDKKFLPWKCSCCGKRIGERVKCDVNTDTGKRYHTTCGLVRLTQIPTATWIGRRVMHPSQQGPNKFIDWSNPDQGVIVEYKEANWTANDSLMQYDVWFRPDGQNLKKDRGYWLRYAAFNLWTRP